MKVEKSEIVIRRLQFYLKTFMKRRIKKILKRESALNLDEKVVANEELNIEFKITKRKIENISTKFCFNERVFYTRLESRINQNIDRMMKHQKMNYTSVLTILLRLRQVCNHFKLINDDMIQDKETFIIEQITNNQTSRKIKMIEQKMNDLTKLINEINVKMKSCNMCSMKLTTKQTKTNVLKYIDCETNYVAQTRKISSKSKKKKSKSFKHHSKINVKFKSRVSQIVRNRKIVLNDSNEKKVDD